MESSSTTTMDAEAKEEQQRGWEEWGETGTAVGMEVEVEEKAAQRMVLLPEKAVEDEGKKTLVLDLDETLVHSSTEEVAEYDFVVELEGQGEMEMMRKRKRSAMMTTGKKQQQEAARKRNGEEEEEEEGVKKKKRAKQKVWVVVRPGVEEFLRAMAPMYELVLFTAGVKEYAEAVMGVVDKEGLVRHRLYRDSCSGAGLFKDLGRLGRPLRDVLLLDNNSPHTSPSHPHNALPIPSFFHDRSDRHLLRLIPSLSRLARLHDVRRPFRSSSISS